jgi:hypothetical protein
VLVPSRSAISLLPSVHPLYAGDPLVSTLATHLTHLRSLCLKDCWALTPAALRSIGDGLRVGSRSSVVEPAQACFPELHFIRAHSIVRNSISNEQQPA